MPEQDGEEGRVSLLTAGQIEGDGMAVEIRLQMDFGRRRAPAIHNKEWVAKMHEIGLPPSDIVYELRDVAGRESVVIVRVIDTSRDGPAENWPS